MSLCQGYDVFGGDIYRLVGSAVIGSACALVAFFVGSPKFAKNGSDWRNSLYVKTSLFLLSFFIYADIIYSIFAIPCQYNVIHILGAGNLDTVGGYQVFDIEWIRIAVAMAYYILAFHDYHRYENGHWYMMIGNAAAYCALNFGISRTVSFDFIWFAFTMNILIGILLIVMRLVSSKAFGYKDWKLYVSEIPLVIFMAANTILVMVANPVYNIQGSRFRAFFYPSITFLTAILAFLVIVFLTKRRTGRNGDVASLHGNLATEREKEESKRSREVSIPALFSR